MKIPESDVKACGTCKQPVIQAITPAKRKGEPVIVLIEPDEDAEQRGVVSNTWVLDRRGGSYYAGRVTNRNQRAAMLSRGIRFHLDHRPNCGTQPTTRRRYK